jgi:hypothetical protein
VSRFRCTTSLCARGAIEDFARAAEVDAFPVLMGT